MLIKPSNSLQERMLLRILLSLLTRITPHTEPMHYTGVQINLIRLLRLHKDRFGFVALLSGEYLVCFRGGDGERSVDGGEFGFVNETGTFS